MPRRTATRAAALILMAGVLLMPAARPARAAAPNVREVTPAGITIDGSSSDWTSPGADYLADMYEAGKPDKDVLANLYGRYDCGTETFYVLVTTVSGWVDVPSNNDNYVKLGQTDKPSTAVITRGRRHRPLPTSKPRPGRPRSTWCPASLHRRRRT